MSDTSLKKSTIIEVSVVRILVVVAQVVFLKFYSSYTSIFELGIFYFLLTISYSLNAFLLVPLDYFQQSQIYTLKNSNYSLKSFFSINVFILKISTVLLIAGNIICFFINPGYCYTIIIIILLALSTYAVNLLRGFINNLENRRKAIYCLLFEYLLKIAFFFLYIHFYKSSALIILLSLFSASFSSFIVLSIIFINLNEYKFKEARSYNLKDVFVFSYPMSIGAVINWIQSQSYSLLLVPLGLTEVVGIYATVANVGSGGMNAYSTIFSQLFIPNIYKSKGAYLKTYIRNAFLSIIFVLLCSALFSKIIIGLLTKHDFVKYSLLLLYGVAGEGANFLIGALTIYLTLNNITKASIKLSFIGLTVFLIAFFALYLLHLISVYTIGIPMIITQCVIIGGIIWISRKHAKQKQ